MTVTLPLHAQPEQPRVSKDQQLLAEIEAVFRRFMVFPHEHAYTVATLWVAHTHLRAGQHGEHFLPRITPRLYYGSKEAGCGKTMAMELTTLMSFNGKIMVEPTQPGMVAAINTKSATIGLDEIDLYFGTRGTARSGVRAILNTGYKKGATIDRERQEEVEERNVHGPACTAGKNAHRFLTAETFSTLRTRSLAIILEKKGHRPDIDRYRSEVHESRLRSISARMAVWGKHNGQRITGLTVDTGLDDRDEEIWTVLFQIAAHVGGEWPARVVAAARAMVLNDWGDGETPVQSFAEQVLHAVRGVYGPGETFLPVKPLLERLMDVDGWWQAEWRNPTAAAMGLAAELATFGIEGTRAYVDGVQRRGYALVDLLDVEDDPEPAEPAVEVAEWNWSELDDE